jgi:hypothetical protein
MEITTVDRWPLFFCDPESMSAGSSAVSTPSRKRIDTFLPRNCGQIIIMFVTSDSNYYQGYILIKYKQSTTNMEGKKAIGKADPI